MNDSKRFITALAAGSCLLTASLALGQNANRRSDTTKSQDAEMILAIIQAWGPCKGSCPYDLTGDDTVNIDDLLALLEKGSANRPPKVNPPLMTDPRIDPSSNTRPYHWHSGIHRGTPGIPDPENHDNPGDTDPENPEPEAMLSTSTQLTRPGAAWLRVRLADYNLGHASVLVLRSKQDGGTQRHTAKTLKQWYNYSAIFNGDSISIELLVAPGDEKVFVEFDQVIEGQFLGGVMPKTICDTTDDRVASTDFRVGRAVLINGNRFCSFWLASNGSVITAGHCVDFGSSGDGTFDLAAGTLIEFRFPASLSDGTPVAANPNDQYPVNITSPQFDNTDAGQDWAVIRIDPSADGTRAHVDNGFFRMTRETPAVDTTNRITGCGTDNGTQNRTLQTETGPYKGEGSSGARFWHTYRTDTTSGNSGSPVIWNAFGVTIGIHTNGGCSTGGSGTNLGCSFEHNPLEIAVDDYPGSGTLYVDKGMPALGPAESGNIFRPFNTVTEGVNALVAGNVLSIVKGTYSETFTITKAMTIEAPVGTVNIGN